MAISDRNATTQSERNAEEIVIIVRNAVADLINADPVVKQALLKSRVAEICTLTLNLGENYQELLADKIN